MCDVMVSFVCMYSVELNVFWIEAENLCRQQHLCVSVCVYISTYLYRSVRVYISMYLHQHISEPISTCLHQCVSVPIGTVHVSMYLQR